MIYEKEILQPREEINKINEEIILKIRERVNVAKKIAEIKRKYNKPIVDIEREKIVLNQVKQIGLKNGLDPERIEKIFQEIINLCVEAEEKIK
ncbi:chorismate mutase [Candidatus Bathyarchaeota archaeon]|nr:chorismate mutase [Candidatus Bathyarchaeota archaeon]